MKGILVWIVRVFMVAPWWMKLIIIAIIWGIISTVFEGIIGFIGMPFYVADNKRKEKEKIDYMEQIKEKIASNSEEAFTLIVEGLESKKLNYAEYEKFLIKIAEEKSHIKSVLKLIELYEGKGQENFKNEEKCWKWIEHAAKSGHIESIIKYYGISDYDVSSKEYDEILQVLSKTSVITETEKDIPNAEIILDELEKMKFQVSADDYLNLYNYYVKKRNMPRHSYATEIKYVEKYAVSKEAKIAIVNRIGGDSYYKFAVEMEALDSNTENNEEIIKAYKKAADYGNADALYYLGKYYWLGVKQRDYFQAIQLMGRAAEKGHTQARQTLGEYGFEGILIKTMQNEKSEYKFLNGHTLTASVKTIQWFQMYYGIKYQGLHLTQAFKNNYTDIFKSFNQMINGVHQLYADYLAYMLQWCIRLLMSFDIDTYSAEDIVQRCDDLSLLSRVPRFEQKLEQIDYRA